MDSPDRRRAPVGDQNQTCRSFRVVLQVVRRFEYLGRQTVAGFWTWSRKCGNPQAEQHLHWISMKSSTKEHSQSLL